MTATYSRPSRESLAWWDRDSSCWRTWQLSFDHPNGEPSSDGWPISGMTCGGQLYELPMSVPAIDGPGCSLLPTPTANEGPNRDLDLRQRDGRQMGIAEVVRLLPTPAAHEPGWTNSTPVDRDGETPTHANQRWYDAETGRLMQPQVVRLLPKR